MGTCLEDTYWHLYHKVNKNDYTIIHAIVQRPSDGLRHPHSVVYNKKTGYIHEVSNDFKIKNVVIPFLLWVRAGKVSDIIQYTFQEYNTLLLETQRWDFWGLIKKGLVK